MQKKIWFLCSHLCYTSCFSSLQFPSSLSVSPSLDVSSTWANMSAIKASSRRFRTLYTSSSCFLRCVRNTKSVTFYVNMTSYDIENKIWSKKQFIILISKIPDVLICDDKGLTERLSRVKPNSRVLLYGGGQLARDRSRTGMQGAGNSRQQSLICAPRAHSFIVKHYEMNSWNLFVIMQL